MYYKGTINLLILVIFYSVNAQVFSKPLEGYVSNDPKLIGGSCKYDPRGKVHKGKIQFEHIRGLIGCQINPQTGRIDFIYPDSNLIKLGVQTGTYILEIEHERYRPCLLPNVVIYPKAYILNLLIKTPTGEAKRINVPLVDYKNYLNTDS